MGLRLSLFMRMRHYPFLFKTVQKMFDHMPMVMSVTLHVFVIFLLTYDFYSESKKNTVSVPMFVVDLTDVKIGPMTNLPPKLLENAKKPAKTKKNVKTSSYSTAKGGKKSEGTGASRGGSSGESGAFATSGASLESELNSMLDSISSKKKKKEKASNSVKATSDGSADGDPFKTLLASVDGIRSGMGMASDEPEVSEEDRETDGIEGGSGGSYVRELSVSEKDMLGLKLRQCWNLDPGVRGVQNMTVEIRAYLNRDGTVRDTKILNTGRYKKDPAFRSVAESARRAVYICDKKGEESPFKIFPKYYEQTYDNWKTLMLRFNPFDGGVL